MFRISVAYSPVDFCIIVILFLVNLVDAIDAHSFKYPLFDVGLYRQIVVYITYAHILEGPFFELVRQSRERAIA